MGETCTGKCASRVGRLRTTHPVFMRNERKMAVLIFDGCDLRLKLINCQPSGIISELFEIWFPGGATAWAPGQSLP